MQLSRGGRGCRRKVFDPAATGCQGVSQDLSQEGIREAPGASIRTPEKWE